MMVFLDNVSQEASAAKAALGDTSHQQQKVLEFLVHDKTSKTSRFSIKNLVLFLFKYHPLVGQKMMQ